MIYDVGVCHQKKVRDKLSNVEHKRDLFGKWWNDIDTDIKKAEIKEVSYSVAKNVVEKYEWMGCMPAIVWHTYGIFFDGVCGGVVCYGPEYSENLGHWDKYDYTGKLILLSRGVCVHWAHKHSASKLISSSMGMLPDKYKVVTSTTDHLAGEIGTIYQACNFDYVGSMRDNNPNVNSSSLDRFGVEINGKLYGSRGIRAKLGTQKKEVILEKYPDAKFVSQNSKHRYFYFLGSKTDKKYHRSKIEHMIKEYPKRK